MVILVKVYIKYLLLFVMVININQVVYSQMAKSDSINIDKVDATKKLYREIRCLTEEIKNYNSNNKKNIVDTLNHSELRSQLFALQEKITKIENRQDQSYLPVEKEVQSISLTKWLILILVFIIGILIGYVLPKKKVQ